MPSPHHRKTLVFFSTWGLSEVLQTSNIVYLFLKMTPSLGPAALHWVWSMSPFPCSHTALSKTLPEHSYYSCLRHHDERTWLHSCWSFGPHIPFADLSITQRGDWFLLRQQEMRDAFRARARAREYWVSASTECSNQSNKLDWNVLQRSADGVVWGRPWQFYTYITRINGT